MANGNPASIMPHHPEIGDLLIAELPMRRPPGHEQTGLRPVLVVADPNKLGVPRFPTLVVVPLSSNIGIWSKNYPKLYPILKKGQAGLVFNSVVLLDNVMAVDAARVRRRLGKLNAEEYAEIKNGLLKMQEA